MKLSTVAILLGAAVAAVPGVVSAEVSSRLGRGVVGGCISSVCALERQEAVIETAAVITMAETFLNNLRALHTLLSAWGRDE